MSGKPVAEQEIGNALLQEIVAYAETSMSRRKFILHYFGEEFDGENGEGADMDDNARNPKKKEEAKDAVVKLLKVVKGTNEKFKTKEIVKALVGKTNALAYVEENDITRPDDLVVKSTGANSGLKLYIIQNVDRKLPLDDIAAAKGLEIPKLIKEMEQIVFSGTKLNLAYWVDEILDEDQQEEIHEYFLEAESDSIDDAVEEFDGDYEEEELRLYRLKFISEVAN